VGYVFAADHHGTLYDAPRDQGVGEIERGEHAGAGIQNVERHGMAEAEVMLEAERRTGLHREASVGAIVAGDIPADEEVDVARHVPGAVQAVGNGSLRQVDGEFLIPRHASGPDASEALEWQELNKAVAAAHHLPSREGARREINSKTLNRRRRLAYGRCRCVNGTWRVRLLDC
jgi:hypothetical protein